MTFGITGNPDKEHLWQPVADLIAWLRQGERTFRLHECIAEGLTARELLSPSAAESHTGDLARVADVILSFGGDGTLLRTAHEVGASGTPLLGVNIGRLGFLADIEEGRIQAALEAIEAGRYQVQERMTLDVETQGAPSPEVRWALNEFVIDRSGSAGLLRIDIAVDGTSLNTYRADGLIMATPTGSTAYSLSAGGPIIAPGADALILTPIAPHTLTVRPIVLPGTATVMARVHSEGRPFVLAADGASTVYERSDVEFTMGRAGHTVSLVKLPEQHFFRTLRSKLMWGAHRAPARESPE